MYCPARFNRGGNQAQTIGTDELYCRQVCFFNFKETPSREEHKTCFSVLTTIELNLMAEFTKSCEQRSPYNDPRSLTSVGWWSYGTTSVPYNHQPGQWILSMSVTILHSTIILRSRYRTILSSASAGRTFMSQILAHSSQLLSQSP